MAVDNIFGDKEAQETPAPSKDKSKKHVAPASLALAQIHL